MIEAPPGVPPEPAAWDDRHPIEFSDAPDAEIARKLGDAFDDYSANARLVFNDGALHFDRDEVGE